MDPEPRSRKPIQYHHQHQRGAGSVGSSEGIGGSETSLEESQYYVGSVRPQVTSTTSPSLRSNSQAGAKSQHHNSKHKHLSIEGDRSGSQAKDSPYCIQSETRSPNLEKSGISSPNSISSKDSGCSGSYDVQSSIPGPGSKPGATLSSVEEIHDRAPSETELEVAVKMFPSSADSAGFSTQKRRSCFEEAIKELELVYNNIANDEDLLDRAERRDLPTAHQLLIWRDRDSSVSRHNTSAESAMSDFDNFLNWNTSSSFEHLATTSTPARARTPVIRQSGLSDRTLDDMAFRRISAANKVPSTLANISTLASQSYLSITSALSPSSVDTTMVGETNDPADSDEPDIRIDDVLFRNIRDANKIKIIEPQPKFGIPLGPITAGANSDYLHAVPDDEKYRSTFNSMRNPDLVKDDLAFRHLRKDENQGSDPSHLGIVKDPHGLIVSTTNWPPKKETQPTGRPFIYYPNKHNPIMRSLSGNIAQIIRKQSSRPGGRLDDIITYEDLSNPVVYDSIKYTMDLITKEKIMADRSGSSDPPGSSPEVPSQNYNVSGTTVYDILRHYHSNPDLSKEDIGGDDEVTRPDVPVVTPDEGVCISPACEVVTETSQSRQDVGDNEAPACDPVQSTESQVK